MQARPDPAPRRSTSACSRSASIGCGRASAPGTRCSRARPAPTRRAAARSATSSARLPYIAAMGFDVLYLPPIHPIGRSFRKGPNNTLTPGPSDPGSPWAIGARRGRPHGDRTRARHARRLRPLRRRGASGTGSRSRSTSPSSARPTIRTCASIPSGSATGPTARSSTPRTRPRSTRTSTRSTSSRDDWRALWHELQRRHRVLDRARRDDLPRRQPAHQAVPLLGVGDRRGQARASRRDLPRRGVHAAEGDALPGQARLHAVVHLLHLAQHQGGADRVLHRADRRPTCASTCGRTCSPNTPDILHEYLQHGGRAGVRGAARAGGDARRELRHLQRLRAVRERRRSGRAARSTSTRRSTRSGRGTSTQPDSLRRADRARQRDPPRASGAAARSRPALPRRPTTSSCSATASARRTAATSILVVVNLDPRQHAARLRSELPLAELEPRRRAPAYDVAGPARRTRRYTWRGEWNYVAARPGRAAWRTSCDPLPAIADDSAISQTAQIETLPIRSGTRTRSSTRCTSARSSTATTTASATSPA